RAWKWRENPGVASSGHRGVLRLLGRIAREPGRERAYVEVAVLGARAGSLRASTLREAVDIARELGDDDARVALLTPAAEKAAAPYTDAERAWLFEQLGRVHASARRFEPAADLLE